MLTHTLFPLALFGFRAAYFVTRRQISRLGMEWPHDQKVRTWGKSSTCSPLRWAGVQIHGVWTVEFMLGQNY